MKHSKEPFVVVIEEEQEESPPGSPVGGGDGSDGGQMEHCQLKKRKTYLVAEAKNKEEVGLTKYTTSGAPVKMQTILAQYTKDQMRI
ncbi:unnamed protein product [Arabis nemorensis]|uniref:Uncharacterized protein n=1 Tax=Arabis nemorensis TaxID=586526 RepID=A0A565CUY4_9BRAS|nr:unnamed protein product [Arabis nemorensis]